MNNNLLFLPIEIQNIIFSYTRPVYPFIKELKEKEEERQREIDGRIKENRTETIEAINWRFAHYNHSNTDLSYIMYFKNKEHFFNIIVNRSWILCDFDAEYDSDMNDELYDLAQNPFEWCNEIDESGGSINYFKKLKSKKTSYRK